MMDKDRISKILFKHDFMGLANMGVPKDEYDPEAEMLEDKLEECESADDVGDHLHTIFTYMFEGFEFSRASFDSAAWKIWKEYEKERDEEEDGS